MERDPAVGQAGGVGVAELVRGDLVRGAVGVGEPGGDHGFAESFTEPGGSDLSAVVDEYEIGGAAVTGVR